jgi:hypothetical protein
VENSERGAFRYLGSESAQRISFSIQFRNLTMRGAKIKVCVYAAISLLGYKNRFAKITSLSTLVLPANGYCEALSISLSPLAFFPEQSPSDHFAPGQRKLLQLQTADKNESAR